MIITFREYYVEQMNNWIREQLRGLSFDETFDIIHKKLTKRDDYPRLDLSPYRAEKIYRETVRTWKRIDKATLKQLKKYI
jgi:hypothetical protein